MLHIIQSRHPINVADVNLCVVGEKMSEFSIQKSMRTYISKLPKNRRCILSICQDQYARFELKRNKNCWSYTLHNVSTLKVVQT